MLHAGIRDCFDVVCSVDDAGLGGKERPDIFLYTAKNLGVAPEDCTVFEDILIAVRTAKSVGMQVWAMFDASSQGDWECICKEADGVIRDFDQAPLRL